MESLSAIIFDGAGVFITGEYVALGEAVPMLLFGAAVLVFAMFLLRKTLRLPCTRGG